MSLSRRRALAGLAALTLPWPSPATAERGSPIELQARKGMAKLLPDSSVTTEIWGFEGVTPGPLLRVQQGQEFKIRIHNALSLPMSVHWHGARIVNAMDGSPLTQEPIAPATAFDYVLTPPDAGTFWYHSLITEGQLRGRGLYGMLVVEERIKSNPVLDLPIIIGDWILDQHGQIDVSKFGRLSDAEGEGLIGNHLTVNGQYRPVLETLADRMLRARVLNAANARILKLFIEGAKAVIIAHDGQPCDMQPVGSEGLTLAPGQRADLLFEKDHASIRFAAEVDGAREHIGSIVRNGNLTTSGDEFHRLPANSVADYFNIGAMQDVVYTIEGGRGSNLTMAKLAGALVPIKEVRKLGLVWTVNGSAGLAPEPLFSVGAGVTIALTVDNVTHLSHTLHIHGHAAWLVERGGEKLAAPIWLDTFIVDPLQPVKLLFIADNPGHWLIASAVAEHFESGCQAWFEVK